MKKILIAMLAVLSLGACAPNVLEVDLAYTPQEGVAAVGGANTVQLAVTVNDLRNSYRDRISTRRGLYGSELTPIVARQKVHELVASAIETELRARGFSTKGGKVFVLVDINRFYADFKPFRNITLTSVAEVLLNVQVLNAGGRIFYSRAYMSEYEQVSDIMMAHDANAKNAIQGGLAKAVEQMMSDAYFIQALVEAQRG